jgi:hypothetical protein
MQVGGDYMREIPLYNTFEKIEPIYKVLYSRQINRNLKRG